MEMAMTMIMKMTMITINQQANCQSLFLLGTPYTAQTDALHTKQSIGTFCNDDGNISENIKKTTMNGFNKR